MMMMKEAENREKEEKSFIAEGSGKVSVFYEKLFFMMFDENYAANMPPRSTRKRHEEFGLTLEHNRYIIEGKGVAQMFLL